MDNIIGIITENNYEKNPVPQDQLQREVDYIRAQQILDSIDSKRSPGI